MVKAASTTSLRPRADYLSEATARASEPRSAAVAAGLSAADGVVDDLASNDRQLVMLVLAQGTQPGQCLVLGAAAPTHHDADRPVDNASRLQRRLQLCRQPLRLRQHLRVLHRDRGWDRVNLPKLRGPFIEDMPVMGVHVHRPDHPVGGDQR